MHSTTVTLRKPRRNATPWGIHAFFVIFSLICLIPVLYVLSASFSNEQDLQEMGFQLFPPKVDLTAYQYVFANPKVILDAYIVTIITTVVGTFFSVLFMAMCAYALSRSWYRHKKLITIFLFIPTLFSGGLVPSYIINTQYLGLRDNIWALILPGLVNVYNIFMIRTFFQQLPQSLFEAVKIDGGNEFLSCFRFALPLSKPVLATVAFLGALARWNEWYGCMLYIRSDELNTLQYLLQRMMMNIEAITRNMTNRPASIAQEIGKLPGESFRFATVMVTIGPMLLVFPFFQKYLVKGMVLGAVKG